MKTWKVLLFILPIGMIVFLFFYPRHEKPANLNEAIQSGTNYLIQSIKNENYSLSCLSSSTQLPCPTHEKGEIFSGFFIADSVKIPEELRNKIITRLQKERQGSPENYSWGYTKNAPPDADDTTFGLRTLLLLSIKINPNGLNQFYDTAYDAYTTLLPERKPAPSIMPASINNREIHPETNANIFSLFHILHLNDKINFNIIKNFQSAEGYWHHYFYPGKYFSTYMSMNLLCTTNAETDVINKGKKFILAAQNHDGSWGNPGNAFDTALALNTLIACHENKNAATAKGIQYLLQTQHRKGYWTNSQSIWEYIPSDNPHVTWKAYDNNYVVTTALAVKALSSYSQSTQ